MMAMHPGTEHPELERDARTGRYLVLRTVHDRGAGHIGGSLSAMDILMALYFKVLRIRPEEPCWPDRDRFILSKGHAAIGLYTVLALRGYLPVEELATFDTAGSRLQAHPDMTRLPGLDASTGSLGQGLSFGLGIALAARRLGKSFHTFVVMGDGEIQEGMIWEAAHVAPRYGTDNLTAILDYNGLQQYGWPGSGKGDRRDPWESADIAAAFGALGWRVQEIDGHDFKQIIAATGAARSRKDGRPMLIIAHTRKGRGVSFMDGRHLWHAGIPTEEETALAKRELGIDDAALESAREGA
jgi:transketolase